MRFVVGLLLLVTAARGTELSEIDRSIRRLPKFKESKQFYALVALGAKANTRVWIVIDGDDLYFDRNGNGDLAEAGEKFAGKSRRGREKATRVVSWKPDRLTTSNRYTEIRVAFSLLNQKWRPGRHAPNRAYLERYMGLVSKTPDANLSTVTLTIAGRRRCICTAMFTTTPETAPVFRADGPLGVGVVETILPFRFERGENPEPLRVTVGTQGHGGDQPGCFSQLHYDEFPKDARPIAVVEFPARLRGRRLPPREYKLARRC
ncbi:MAG: hypothetical protein ACYTHK_17230 [Planctomycetota bacterium]|jgi:hypothetical protein